MSITIDKFLDIKDVTEMVKRSRASIYRDIKRGTFPAPRKLGGSSRWRLSDVQQVIAG